MFGCCAAHSQWQATGGAFERVFQTCDDLSAALLAFRSSRTRMRATFTLTEPGSITFEYQVSSRGNDSLNMYFGLVDQPLLPAPCIPGIPEAHCRNGFFFAGGELPWTRVVYPLSEPGDYAFVWEYFKGDVVGGGDDTARVRDIYIVNGTGTACPDVQP